MVSGVGAVFASIALISFFEMFGLLRIGFDLSVFNPIRNYNQWRKINWFGVIVATILLNVIFPLYAIVYWGYKLVTVGRR
jgi:hypothetical protein